MGDRRLISLLVFVLVVVTISFILVSVWGYRYYFEDKKGQKTAIIQTQPKADSNSSFSDSLQHLLDLSVAHLHETAGSISIDSSSDTALASKLIEFNRLKNEIAQMLKTKYSQKGMNDAGEKIAQLQQSVEELKNQNDEVAAENERLSQMVKQLIDKKNTSSGAAASSPNHKHLASSAYTLPVLVAHLRFVGLSLANNKSVTNIAAKTERLYGSFQINIKPYNKNHFIYIVITQPDGKTLTEPSGNSGTFKTGSGTKPFSSSIRFDNKSDNGHRLVFTIDAHNFQRGKYTMEIYHQGVMIGKLTRTFF